MPTRANFAVSSRKTWAALLLAVAVVLSGCDLQAGTAGARCPKVGAYAQDGTYVLKCNGRRRWERGITLAAGNALLDAWTSAQNRQAAPEPTTAPIVSGYVAPTTPPTTTSTVPPKAPSPPLNVIAYDSDRSIEVEWSPPLSDGGAAIVRYTATAFPSGKTCTGIGASPYLCVISGLAYGDTQNVTVTTTNAAGLTSSVSGFGTATPYAVVKVSTAGRLSCGLVSNTKVACWGSNDYGQLGRGTQSGYEDIGWVDGLTGVLQVEVGYDHACAVLVNGRVYCWGSNAAGKLGDGTTDFRSSPVEVVGIVNAVRVSAGDRNSCAVLTTGAVQCWGLNSSIGELGSPPIPLHSVNPIPITASGVSGATDVAVGDESSCAIVEAGGVKCWGYPSPATHPQDNNSYWLPRLVPGISGATSIAIGATFACALTSGVVKCWGGGVVAPFALSIAATEVVGLPAIQQLAAGDTHMCVRSVANQVWCWGNNYYGELGVGDAPGAYSPTPLLVTGYPVPMDLASGGRKSCVVPLEGGFTCWGQLP